MAKPDLNYELTQGDLEKYLEQADDFAFEMAVHRFCLEKDPHALHGGVYQDPISKLTRQFDIRVNFGDAEHRMALAIECKNISRSYPLLVSRVNRMQLESFHQVIVTGYSSLETIAVTNEFCLYPKGDFVGKATVQVGKALNTQSKNLSFVSADSETYDKWSQAVSSAADLVQHASKRHVHATRTIVIPILAVPDQTLWVADYMQDGSRPSPPQRAQHCSLFLAKKIPSSQLSGDCCFLHDITY